MDNTIDIARYLYLLITLALSGLIYWVRWSIKQSTVSQRDFDDHVRNNERDIADLQASLAMLATKDDVQGIMIVLTKLEANQNQHAKQAEALIDSLNKLPKS